MPNLSASPYSFPSLDQYKAFILDNVWSLHEVVHLDDSAGLDKNCGVPGMLRDSNCCTRTTLKTR